MNDETVLVTGARGYLGSVLMKMLDDRGYGAIGVDNNVISRQELRLRKGRYLDADIRDVAEWEKTLEGVDAVVHLAAIVGDPACNLNEDLTWETNYLGTVYLAEACRRRGVRTFAFASTCSNYGLSFGEAANIYSPLHPQSVYAESKIHAEHHLLVGSDGIFVPRILRLSTLYGLSPRMRFDLVVNMMTARAVTDHRITVHGGNQWRPFLHVRDAANAFVQAIESRDALGSKTWNCGSKSQNYRIADIAAIVAGEVPEAKIEIMQSVVDERDYFVDFEEIREDLGFTPQHEILDEVRAIAAAAREGRFGDARGARYVNVDLIRHALDRDDPVVELRRHKSRPHISFGAA
ncbi:SDR family oxidoreductase [Streptomyces sp. NPDC050388]|uniref:NAD-dependent epimerase/dehydratase family protein n=1 Tax=Streptomyces sp. NPDC050388 TaxID=3155781 RepID=UPI00342AAC6A